MNSRPQDQPPPAPSTGHTLLDLPAAAAGAQVSAEPAGAPTAGASAGPTTAAPVAAPTAEPPSSKMGRYRILREHARGGMGRVLLALDTTIGRNVAVKELLSGLAAETGASAATKSIGERFLREARVTGRLEHPNIVPVYEIGTNESGAFFYSMRFVGGRTMAQRLQDIAAGSGSPRDKLAGRLGLLEAFQDVCNAVAYAHSRGVIHRDLKPSNVMLGEFGETVVLDWGLARLHGEADIQARGNSDPAAGDSAQLTLDGAVVGTPAYMPPEQARGEQHLVDERADVYSLGAMLYELLTGRAPFEGPGAHAVLKRVITESPRPVLELEPGVPRELAVLCGRAMERDREQRFGSALELATEVKAFRDGKALASYEYTSLELLLRFLRRQWRLMAVIGIALAVVGAIAVVAVREVVNERNAARQALNAAEAAEARRREAAELADSRERALQESRRDAIQRAREAVAGYNAEPLLRDLMQRVEGYRREQRELGALNAAERERNRALVTAVLGYAAQLQELLRLQGSEARPQDVEDLARLQAALVELAIFDGDFELADYLLSGSGLPEETLARLAERNRVQREAMLAWRAGRVAGALQDARAGLRREGRPDGLPSLAQYVATLAAFQDAQTVDLLGAELKLLHQRIAAGGVPAVIEFDQADLLCRTLGRLQQPSRAVPLLAGFLAGQTHPRTAAAAMEGLAATQDRAGTLALAADARRRSLRFLEARRAHYAAAWLPPGLAQD
ncbi:MAG: serine/threonine protein kinase, partial [Planctomycetes bacterium]|nr:serine/threonine protein kinase [Planctomycetota bacterium]